MQRLVPFRWPGCLWFHALLSGFPSISLNPASFLAVASEARCRPLPVRLLQSHPARPRPAENRRCRGWSAFPRRRLHIVITCSAYCGLGQHSPWPFLCAVHPRPAARSFLFSGARCRRHLVVSGLWPSVLLECCIWQRYVLIFISQCHCEHLFHRLPWDFFLLFAVLCRCRCR